MLKDQSSVSPPQSSQDACAHPRVFGARRDRPQKREIPQGTISLDYFSAEKVRERVARLTPQEAVGLLHALKKAYQARNPEVFADFGQFRRVYAMIYWQCNFPNAAYAAVQHRAMEPLAERALRALERNSLTPEQASALLNTNYESDHRLAAMQQRLRDLGFKRGAQDRAMGQSR